MIEQLREPAVGARQVMVIGPGASKRAILPRAVAGPETAQAAASYPRRCAGEVNRDQAVHGDGPVAERG